MSRILINVIKGAIASGKRGSGKRGSPPPHPGLSADPPCKLQSLLSRCLSQYDRTRKVERIGSRILAGVWTRSADPQDRKSKEKLEIQACCPKQAKRSELMAKAKTARRGELCLPFFRRAAPRNREVTTGTRHFQWAGSAGANRSSPTRRRDSLK